MLPFKLLVKEATTRCFCPFSANARFILFLVASAFAIRVFVCSTICLSFKEIVFVAAAAVVAVAAFCAVIFAFFYTVC